MWTISRWLGAVVAIGEAEVADEMAVGSTFEELLDDGPSSAEYSQVQAPHACSSANVQQMPRDLQS